LVLNRHYLPIHITSVKRAVSLLCLEVATGLDGEYQTYSWDDLLESFPDENKTDHFYYLKGVQGPIPIPKVLLLHGFDKRPPQTVKFSRGQVFLRDRFTCQYCSKTLPKQRLNIDHVVPRTQGGKTTWENVVTSCHYCNRKKGGRTPIQANMKLLTVPYKPSIAPVLTVLHEQNPTWSAFLFTP
jgi:hypothetical protein